MIQSNSSTKKLTTLVCIEGALQEEGEIGSYMMTEMEWIFPVLDDLHIFARTNNMHQLAAALVNAKRATANDIFGTQCEANAVAASSNVVAFNRAVLRPET